MNKKKNRKKNPLLYKNKCVSIKGIYNYFLILGNNTFNT